MTVTTLTNTKSYDNPGDTQDTFAYDFLVLDASHVQCYLDGVLISSALYTVQDVGAPQGGDILFGDPADAGPGILRIERQVPIDQLADYRTGDAFPAESHEAALDKLTMIAQQQQEELDRALLSVGGGSGGYEVRFTEPLNNTLLAFDDNGEFIINIELAENKAYRWAEEDENVVVENRDGRDRYSAFHWAQKAENIAAWGLSNIGDIYVGDGSMIPATVLPIGDTGQTLVVDKTETVPGTPDHPTYLKYVTIPQALPGLSSGDKLKMLQVNLAETGYELTEQFADILIHAKDMLEDDGTTGEISATQENHEKNVVQQFPNPGVNGVMGHINGLVVRRHDAVDYGLRYRLTRQLGDNALAAGNVTFIATVYLYSPGSSLVPAAFQQQQVTIAAPTTDAAAVDLIFPTIIPMDGADLDVMASVSLKRSDISNTYLGKIDVVVCWLEKE